jgi:hypothetical protein
MVLKAYLKVLEIHFGMECFFAQQLHQILKGLMNCWNGWMTHMIPKILAQIVWAITLKSQEFFKAGYSAGGRAPTAHLLLIVRQLSGLQSLPMIGMPDSLIDRPHLVGQPSSNCLVGRPAVKPRARQASMTVWYMRMAASSLNFLRNC